MSVISFKHELLKARAGCYAIPLFDIFDIAGVEGLWETITELRAPAILGIYSSQASQPNAKAFTAYIKCRYESTDIPVTIMLDHGSSVEQCIRVLEFGFTDVMYDGSRLPLDENIANTRKVVQAAHQVGAAVEAELGHVGLGSEYDSYGGRSLGFTDPSEVERFVDKTGIDFLAIAFGNAHGLYKGEPKLDFDLVRKINHRVPIPLVMHGGTGISDDQFKTAITAGICKINYATNIINSATDGMKKKAAQSDTNVFTLTDEIRKSYRDWSSHLFQVFGTAGKG